jgi:hypothetical protein
MTEPNLTERQRKYFAAMQASLERDTGRRLKAWVAIARTCPETVHRARLRWLKENYGLLQNHGSHVLSEAFPPEVSWRDPEKLLEALWTDPTSKAIFEAVDAAARRRSHVVRTARKGYTAWSREFQFAAVKPVRGGTALLGLAVAADASPRLQAARKEGWSERLKSRAPLGSAADVDDEIGRLLTLSWEKS